MRRLYDPDDYADPADTDPGLPCCTIIGPLLPARSPAPPRVPYHVRYPPTIDDPVSILVRPTGELPDSLVEFDFDDDDAIVIDPDGDHPEPIALGSQSKGRAT